MIRWKEKKTAGIIFRARSHFLFSLKRKWYATSNFGSRDDVMKQNGINKQLNEWMRSPMENKQDEDEGNECMILKKKWKEKKERFLFFVFFFCCFFFSQRFQTGQFVRRRRLAPVLAVWPHGGWLKRQKAEILLPSFSFSNSHPLLLPLPLSVKISCLLLTSSIYFFFSFFFFLLSLLGLFKQKKKHNYNSTIMMIFIFCLLPNADCKSRQITAVGRYNKNKIVPIGPN